MLIHGSRTDEPGCGGVSEAEADELWSWPGLSKSSRPVEIKPHLVNRGLPGDFIDFNRDTCGLDSRKLAIVQRVQIHNS